MLSRGGGGGAPLEAGDQGEVSASDAEYPFDLGTYERADVKARFPATVQWFQRGLNWTFAFHHEEAIRCFERALAREPDFALAYWGISICHSPNYNVHARNGYYKISDQPTGFPSMKTAYDSIQRALKFKHMLNSEGLALVEAQRLRCMWPCNDFCHLLLQPYSDALRLVHVAYPHDEDVACLFVESLIQLSPWELFDMRTGAAAPQVEETIKVLSRALERAPRHPGLCHLAVHIFEMSPMVHAALPQADLLREGLVPDAGHLLHMPAHLDVQLGAYGAAIATSERAVVANNKYLAYAARRPRDEFRLYIGYIAHDLHMMCHAAAIGGVRAKALLAGQRLRAFVAEQLRRYRERAVDLDLFHSALFEVFVRFGMWREILEEPLQQDEELFCASNAVLRYARGLAFAAVGELDKARKEQAAFEEARTREMVYRRVQHNNNGTELFAVDSEVLAGEIKYRSGEDFEAAFAHLRRAVLLEDLLPFDEPPGKLFPTRHALGALLLEQRRYDEAEAVFRDDLRRYPRNPWALVGLCNCLTNKRSATVQDEQEQEEERVQLKRELDQAMLLSDCEINHSCACAGLRILSRA
jgi:tetratricopeptide (TPR) repeat protein